MPTDSVIGIVVQARDEATRVLQGVRQEMALFGPSGQVLVDLGKKAEDSAAGVQRLGTSATAALAPMKVLGTELISGLSPALGQVGIAMISVTQATQRLALGLPLLASAGIALATVVGTELVGAILRARETFLAFQRDVQSADLSRITGQVQGLRRELEALTQSQEQLRGRLDPFATIERGYYGFQETRIRQRLEEAARLGGGATSAFARGREFSDYARAEQLVDTENPAASTLDPNRAARRLREQVGIQQRTLSDPIERSRLLAQLAADQTLQEPGGGADQRILASAQRALAQQDYQEALRLRRLAFRAADYASSAGAFDESQAFFPLPSNRLQELETSAQLARLQTPEYAFQREAQLRSAALAGDESAAYGITRPELQAASQQAIQQRVTLGRDELELQRQILEVQSQRTDLTDRQRDALEDQITGLRTAVDLARVNNELESARAVAEEERDNARIERLEKERSVIETIAGVRAQITAQQRLERDNPVAGALRGAQDFEDIAARQGERYRMALFGSLQTISGGITDILVAGLSGDLDRIGDIGKQMGQALMRGLIQELIVTPLVSTLSATLRGAIGGLFGGAGGAATAAGGGGLLALLGLSSPAQAGTAPNLPVGSIVQTAAGTGVVTASGAVVLSSGSATVGALQAPGGDLVAAAGAGASPFGGSASAAATSSQAAVGGTSLTSAALGGFAGAAAVGLTAYSASQYAQTTQDVAFAGVTGAVAGAAAGASIGGYFDSSGYGALIGAVAGAAISAGAAAYGKRNNRPSKADREKQEVSGVAASFQPMFADLDTAQTPEELYAVVKRYTHQGAGGERSGRGAENAGLVATVDIGGRVRVIGGATPDQLVARGDTVQVELIVGVAPEVKAPYEERLANAIKQAASRIRALGDQVRIFFERHLRGGITETTVLTLTRLAEATGQDLSVVAGTLNGLDPEVRDKILARIAANDVDGAVQLYAVESNLQAKVRLGEVLGARAASVPIDPNTGLPTADVPPLTPDEQAKLDDILRQMNTIPGGLDAAMADAITDGLTSDASISEAAGGPQGIDVSFHGVDVTIGVGNTAFTITTTTPTGALGQALSALSGGKAGGNIAGALANMGLGLISGPVGMLAALANLAIGFVAGKLRGEEMSLLGFKVTYSGPRSMGPHASRPRGADVDPDPNAGEPEGNPDEGVPEGSVTVGAPSVSAADNPGMTTGEAAAASGDTSSGIGEGGATGVFAEGGWVPGDPSRGDIVPARVGRRGRGIRMQGGEYVVNPDSAKAHAEDLEEINRRKPGKWPEPQVPSARRPDAASSIRGWSNEDLIAIGNRLAALNLLRDMKWWPSDNKPLTPGLQF